LPTPPKLWTVVPPAVDEPPALEVPPKPWTVVPPAVDEPPALEAPPLLELSPLELLPEQAMTTIGRMKTEVR